MLGKRYILRKFKAGVQLEVVSRSTTADCEHPFVHLDDTYLNLIYVKSVGRMRTFQSKIDDDLPIYSNSSGDDWEHDINTKGPSS